MCIYNYVDIIMCIYILIFIEITYLNPTYLYIISWTTPWPAVAFRSFFQHREGSQENGQTWHKDRVRWGFPES